MADLGPYRPLFASFFYRGGAGAGCGFLFFATQKATPIHYVPAFDGNASSFLDFEQRVTLRNGSADIPADKRATLLILHLDATARQVCLHSGGVSLMEGDDVMTAIQALRDSFQPVAIDRIFR